MKKLIFTVATILATTGLKAQNAAINATGASPNASAMLDVASTTKGLLTPRMTSAQRTAISSPATGLIVYQTDGTDGFYYYDGSAWVLLINGTDALPAVSGAAVTNLNASNLASGTVPTARLGSGTADNSTYLRGDGTWSTPSSSVADNAVTSAKIADGAIVAADIASNAVTGSKLNVTNITSNTTLTSSDFVVTVAGNHTVTLPASPNNGQVYIIIGSGTAGINTNGKSFTWNNGGSATSSTVYTFTDWNTKMLIWSYDSTQDVWHVIF